MGLVQGLTEFLPISSSGHLLLVQYFSWWPDLGLAFDAFLHLGTLLAVLIYFRKDILRLGRSVTDKNDKAGRHILSLILIGIIPAGIVGYFFSDYIETSFRSILIVIFNLIFWGLVMAWADIRIEAWKKKRDRIEKMTWYHSLIIGLAQVFALIPGTSRSGITITAALFQGIDRKTAARFSFLMSVPLIATAGLMSFLELIKTGVGENYIQLSVGLLVSFLSGLVAIYWLLKILEKGNLKWFIVYRIVLGLILFSMFAF